MVCYREDGAIFLEIHSDRLERQWKKNNFFFLGKRKNKSSKKRLLKHWNSAL